MSQKDDAKVKAAKARAAKLTPEERSEIAKRAADERWGAGLPKATHEGAVRVGEAEIACAVLEDGRRVLTQSDFMRALGRARQAKGRKYYDGDVNMPAFLTAKNLKPFISDELAVTSSQIEFKRLRGGKAYGYSADLLPQVCGVFMDAEEAGVLAHNQRHIAAQAKMLIRGLATVGITALVDEATGYQEVRRRDALQALLEKYLRKEFAAWAKTFPDEYYDELFRLRGWDWDSKKRPILVGKLTNDIVYARLAPGILEELRGRNPANEKGRRKGMHHQLLTDDVGHPALAQHLYAVIGIMRASATWNQFKTFLNRAYPKKGETLELALEE